MIKLGFRIYKPDGINSDEMGKYTGKPVAYDSRVALYSIRLQRYKSKANGADPEGNIVWKFKPKA